MLRNASRVLALALAGWTSVVGAAETWYLAIQTTDTVNTPATLSGYKAQYNTHNPSSWVDWPSTLGWFGTGLYYTVNGVYVSHTGQFSMRLVRSSDLAVVGTVGPFSVTGGGPLASQAARTVTFAVPPTGPYKTRVDVLNATDYKRHVKVDLDGNGTWDQEFDLAPGGVSSQTYERDTAPTQNGKVLTSGPNGDGSTSYEVAQIPAGSWSQSPTVATNTATISPGVSVSTNTAPAGKITYGTPTGSASESTLQSGLSAVASAISEAGQSDAALLGKIVSAVDDAEALLRQLTNNTAKVTTDTSQSQSVFNTQKASMQTAIGNEWAPMTSALGSPTAVNVAGTTSPLSFGLGRNGKFGLVSWHPLAFADVLETISLMRAFFVWAIWFLFGRHVFEYSRTSILETIKHSRGWTASSAVPIASTGSAVTMAAIFTAGVTVAAGAIIATALTTLGGLGTADSLQLSLLSSAEWGKIIALANLLFPMNVIFSIAITEVIFRTYCDTISASTLTASRWLVG